jgi:rare lipoprotein A (peptidoglycan hydrolase)
VIDLSTAAAAELGMLSKGVGNVTLEVIAWPN